MRASIGWSQAQVALNPHGDPASCLACHRETEGNADNAPKAQAASSICQACHIERTATHSLHPVDRVPSQALTTQWPAEFPLKEGRMTCLTCHDILQDCRLEASQPPVKKNRLRAPQSHGPAGICRACHVPTAHSRHNVHAQLNAGQPRAESCQWCHPPADDLDTILAEAKPYALRQNAADLCTNCHAVAREHPSGGPHMGIKPSAEMRWYMAAVEMQSHMILSLKQLKRYAQAAQREPQAVPFDDQGRLTCVSCHNPHEQGLWPAADRRAAGAEPAQATDHRLRIGQGKQCLGCHEL